MMRRIAVTLLPLLLAAILPATEVEPISSAEVCGSCHREIQAAWKQSAHAHAMESRLFQDALAMAEGDAGASARKVCLGCHAPLALKIGDRSLKQKVSWEGVTCDYCHSVRQVSFGHGNPEATIDFSKVKSGPLKEVSSMAHGTVFSDVHTTSLICAPCHEYRNSSGFEVLTTYSEWKNSRYGKEDVWCQSCHMARVEGPVVDPSVKAGPTLVNLHEMPGSHSLKQLTKAVQARLRTERKGGQLHVSVTMINSGAGHYVPTGSPMRQLILEVTADAYEGKDYQETRVYRRTVADEKGETLTFEHRAFLRAAKVVSDTRLAPDEKRTEEFSFAIPEKVPVRVKARLSYYYSPMARSESEQKIFFGEISRLVR